jgi:threonine dehydrogenase-like Zn-dependent dehydrogenase
MAASRAAYALEKAVGHDSNAIIEQDITNYNKEGQGSTTETMKALVWNGKKNVQVVDVAKPRIIEDGDAVLRVTGTTICGSDLHLYHGVVVEMAKGDILGHEFCGVVEEVGPGVKGIKVGARYVVSFQIACGEVSEQCPPSPS